MTTLFKGGKKNFTWSIISFLSFFFQALADCQGEPRFLSRLRGDPDDVGGAAADKDASYTSGLRNETKLNMFQSTLNTVLEVWSSEDSDPEDKEHATKTKTTGNNLMGTPPPPVGGKMPPTALLPRSAQHGVTMVEPTPEMNDLVEVRSPHLLCSSCLSLSKGCLLSGENRMKQQQQQQLFMWCAKAENL